MRYFLYKNSRILGPFEKEDLGQAEGFGAETLVCEEGVGGQRDSDWRCAGEVPELSGLGPGPGTSVALADDFLSGSGSEILRRLEIEAVGLGPAESGARDWIDRLFEESDFRKSFEDILVRREDEFNELESAKETVRALSAQLTEFQSRLEQLEGQRNDLLRQLGGKPGVPAAAPSAELPTLRLPPKRPQPPAEDVAAPRNKEDVSAVPGPLPYGQAAPEAPAAPEAEIAPAAQEAPEAVHEPPLSPHEPGRKGIRFVPPARPASAAAAAAKTEIKFAETKTFRVIKRELPPAEARIVEEEAAPAAPEPQAPPPEAPSAFEWQTQPPPARGLPEAGTAPPLGVLTAPGGIFEAPPPAGLAFLSPEPAGMQLSPPPTPTPAPPSTLAYSFQPPPAPTTLEPPPIPSGLQAPSWGTAQPPLTSPFSVSPGGLPPLPSAVLTPSRSNVGAMTPPPATQEIISRLAKPGEAPSTAPPRRRGPSMVFIGGSAALLVLLVGVGFLFLKNPKDIKLMLSMGAEEPSLGTETEEAPAASPPKEVEAAPRAAVPDAGEAAVALVKGYPLDGDRGTVGQWLQYSFTANPGDGNKEEWTAGAVDAATYLVQYRVIPGPASKVQEAITYLFEADLGRKTVKASNPFARELMGGAAPEKQKRKPARRRKAAAKPAEAGKAVPLLPLPKDSDLLPPSEDDASFRSDMVR